VDEAPAPVLPNRPVLEVSETMSSLCSDLRRLEREHRVTYLREPDFGFAQTVWSWVHGASLDDALRETEMAAGDFVRAMKQLIDVLDQIADAAGAGPLRDTVLRTLGELRRGVVAYASVVG
jgi:ATP-dependent RNA helicase HelY